MSGDAHEARRGGEVEPHKGQPRPGDLMHLLSEYGPALIWLSLLDGWADALCEWVHVDRCINMVDMHFKRNDRGN